MKAGGVTLFVCLPEAEAKAYGRFTRVIFGSAMKALYRPPARPVLFVLDEMATAMSGATMDIFTTCFALGRGSGIRIHAVFQDFNQIERMFGKETHTLLSASGVRQYFRPNDEVTAKHLSERCGQHTVSILNESTSINYNGQGPSTLSKSQSWQHYDRPLFTAHDLYDLSPQRQILIFEGLGAPVLAWRFPYTQTPWADRLDPNPFYTPPPSASPPPPARRGVLSFFSRR